MASETSNQLDEITIQNETSIGSVKTRECWDQYKESKIIKKNEINFLISTSNNILL